MKTKQFRFRVEELPALGEFVESSFLRDKEQFAAFSPMYANGYAEGLHAKLEEVKAIVAPEVVTSKRKRITDELHATQKSMRQILTDIERYCQLAGDQLSFTMADLKLREFRRRLNSHNCEASVKHGRMLLQIVSRDITLLQEKGFTTEKQTEMKNLIDTLEKLNLEQNNSLNERKQLVADNKSLFNEFWLLIQDLLLTGQIIHRDNPVKKEEYTKRKLVSRVRLVMPAKKKPDEQVDNAADTPTRQPVESPPLAA